MSAIDRLGSLVEDTAIKTPVAAATTAAIVLSGLQTIDGIAILSGYRVLAKDQANPVTNGVYLASTAGWTRDQDCDSVGDFVQGTIVMVVAGTVNGSTVFQQTTASPQVGVTNLTFAVAGAAALALASSYMRTTVFPQTTAALARVALGAIAAGDNITFTGANTHAGTETWGAAAVSDHTANAAGLLAANQAVSDSSTKVANTATVQAMIAAGAVFQAVRQVVNGGPVDTAGLPTFWPASIAGLVLSTQNLSTTYPLVANAANGNSATTGGPVNVPGYTANNISWNATNGATVFAYATIGAGGVMTPGTTTLAPIYQYGGTPSVTNGQFTFNTSEMRGYMGNGATAPQASIVFFGEITAAAGNISATVMYAYNGRFESAYTATLPAKLTVVTANHNIGVRPLVTDLIIQNTTTDAGYAVGDEMSMSRGVATDFPNTQVVPFGLSTTTKVMSFNTGNATGATYWYVWNKNAGGNTLLTLANWKYKFIASRGW